MKSFRYFLYVTILGLSIGLGFNSCNPDASGGPDGISVSWLLKANQNIDGQNYHDAIFTFTNNSQSPLKDEGWVLYWNQSPRKVLKVVEEARVDIEQINGDWYRMRPLEGFSLEVGQTKEIHYQGALWLIKETDAPLGLYWTQSNPEGEMVIPVAQYEILPFKNPEQIHRFPGDHEKLATADHLFQYNASVSSVDKKEVPLFLPSPKEFVRGEGALVLNGPISIQYSEELEKEALFLKSALGTVYTRNVQLGTSGSATKADFYLEIAKEGNPAASYSMDISTSGGIRILGEDPTGVFYAIQSVLAMLPAEVYRKKVNQLSIPVCSVNDYPAMSYRGLHIDVARNFNNAETIMRILDLMGRYKLNKLHFYLTDDEGWRLEIPQFPELTDYASIRGHSLDEKNFLPPAYGSGGLPDAKDNYGTGYYSKETYQEIIQYAHQRHIEVIPAFNLPGHTRGAIQAMEKRYERLMAEGKQEEAEYYRLIDPNDSSVYLSAQHYTDNIACVCQEGIYHFFEAIVDAIIDMHQEVDVPLNMIHTGGDEVAAGVWGESALCKEFMKSHPEIQNYRNLQTHFFGRAVEILQEKGLQTGGWEEVVMNYHEDGSWSPLRNFVGKEVYPYIWNNIWGNSDLGYKIANAGYPVILCNVTNLYFDMAYSKDPREPGLYWGAFTDTRKAFEFNPYHLFYSTKVSSLGEPFDMNLAFNNKTTLEPEAKQNIVGIQGQLWAETIKGRDMMEYMILPKLFGLAERAWVGQPAWGDITDVDKRSQREAAGWNRFAHAMGNQILPLLDEINGGYAYRIAPPGIRVLNKQVEMNGLYPGYEIRYSLDGSEPGPDSKLYEGPFEYTNETIKARCFNANGRGSLSTSYSAK